MSSKSSDWFNGQRVYKCHGLEKWKRLLANTELSPEFKRQIERNIDEKCNPVERRTEAK